MRRHVGTSRRAEAAGSARHLQRGTTQPRQDSSTECQSYVVKRTYVGMGARNLTDIDAVKCNKHVCSCYKYLCIYKAVIVRNILMDTFKKLLRVCER